MSENESLVGRMVCAKGNSQNFLYGVIVAETVEEGHNGVSVVWLVFHGEDKDHNWVREADMLNIRNGFSRESIFRSYIPAVDKMMEYLESKKKNS